MTRAATALVLAGLSALLSQEAAAGLTVFFSPDQDSVLVGSGTTSDTFSCEGYLFTCSRDKLFTGGGSDTIGRQIRVPWPDGVEAQYVTAGPNPDKARITVRRVDGAIFDLTSFTAKLLANACAGRAIEIVPMLDGEEPLNDPLYFDVSGHYGQEFSYDTSPNPLGSTAALVGYDTYRISLTLDYALTALTASDDVPSAVLDPPADSLDGLRLAPNPARNHVEIQLVGPTPGGDGRLSVIAAGGVRVRSLQLDVSGQASWDLRDDRGRPVPAGMYFVRADAAPQWRPPRIVVVR
jgi:hypothetical protein